MAKTISQLPDATVVNGSDELIIQQSGVTKRATKTEVLAGIVNANIDADAAIAGSKIAPNFGAQNVVTTGACGIGTTSPTAGAKLDVQGGRSFFSANSEPYGLGVRFVSTGGPVYFGAASNSATPDAVISGAGGSALATFKNTGQVRFQPLASDPAGAEAGDVYYNSSSNKLKVYNGTSWVDLH